EESSDDEAAPPPAKKQRVEEPAKAEESSSSDDDDNTTTPPKATGDKTPATAAKAGDDSDSDSESAGEPAAKKQKVETPSGEVISKKTVFTPDSSAENNNFKVFVGGLPYSADEETVKKDFEECGEIAYFKALKDDEGKMKGICFVTYKSQEAVDKALAYNGTDYGGRTIKVNMATQGEKDGKGAGKGGKKGKGPRTEKPEGGLTVVVKRFSRETTEDEIRAHFSEKCGEVQGCRIVKDRETGESKGIAFLDFVETESTDKAVALNQSSALGSDNIVVDFSDTVSGSA
ncbi:unnamed protein product, partial [Amoebophrya sp. A25]